MRPRVKPDFERKAQELTVPLAYVQSEYGVSGWFWQPRAGPLQ